MTQLQIPPIPEGFELETPEIPRIPEGFELEKPANSPVLASDYDAPFQPAPNAQIASTGPTTTLQPSNLVSEAGKFGAGVASSLRSFGLGLANARRTVDISPTVEKLLTGGEIPYMAALRARERELFKREQEAIARQAAKATGISGAAGRAVGMGVTAAPALIPGAQVPVLAGLAASTYGGAMLETEGSDIPTGTRVASAVGKGAIEAITERVGLGAIGRMFSRVLGGAPITEVGKAIVGAGVRNITEEQAALIGQEALDAALGIQTPEQAIANIRAQAPQVAGDAALMSLLFSGAAIGVRQFAGQGHQVEPLTTQELQEVATPRDEQGLPITDQDADFDPTTVVGTPPQQPQFSAEESTQTTIRPVQRPIVPTTQEVGVPPTMRQRGNAQAGVPAQEPMTADRSEQTDDRPATSPIESQIQGTPSSPDVTPGDLSTLSYAELRKLAQSVGLKPPWGKKQQLRDRVAAHIETTSQDQSKTRPSDVTPAPGVAQSTPSAPPQGDIQSGDSGETVVPSRSTEGPGDLSTLSYAELRKRAQSLGLKPPWGKIEQLRERVAAHIETASQDQQQIHQPKPSGPESKLAAMPSAEPEIDTAKYEYKVSLSEPDHFGEPPGDSWIWIGRRRRGSSDNFERVKLVQVTGGRSAVRRRASQLAREHGLTEYTRKWGGRSIVVFARLPRARRRVRDASGSKQSQKKGNELAVGDKITFAPGEGINYGDVKDAPIVHATPKFVFIERDGKRIRIPREVAQRQNIQAPKQEGNVEQKPGKLETFLNPGKPFEAMGAMSDPHYERGPDGKLRIKMRSASDLVGRDESTAAEADYASPNKEFEQRYQEARKGIGKLPLALRLRGFWNRIIENTQRGALPKLPRTTEFGEARSAAQAYRNANYFAVIQTEDLLGRTIKPLSKSDYDLFTRKVIFDDLSETKGALPFGLDAESAKAEAERIDGFVAKNAKVRAAVEYRKRWMEEMKQDYIEAHAAIGVDMSARFKRQNYFRHQVLYWMRIKQLERAGVPAEVERADLAMYRSFLKKREDSVLDINADYLQAEWEVATQMIGDTLRARALARIKKKYDIRDTLKDKDDIPDGYKEYYLRAGSANFMAYSIPESVAQRLFEHTGEVLGITAKDMRRTMASGPPITPMVIPAEIAAQLEEISNPPQKGIIDKAITIPMRWWKQWILLSPRKVIAYQIRNASEVDKAVALNPTTVTKIPRAISDLAKLYSHSENTPSEVKEWVKRGGVNTLVRINELHEVNNLKRFARLLESKEKGIIVKAASLPGMVWRGYWNTVRLGNDFRESILRYAAYLDYLEQIQKSPEGKPGNYGGSVRKEVDGIVDPRDKAMRLSSDLLGDYSDVSVVGQWMRHRVFPFWSFKELNFRTYLNGVKNLASDEQTAVRAGLRIGRALGGAAIVRTPLMAYKLGRLAILFYGFNAALTAINRVLFPEDDDELPLEARRRPHLTLGRDADGQVRYFSRLGTASDFLEWFGANASWYDFMDVMEGRRTLKDIAIDYAKSPVNLIAQGTTPFIKVPVEIATGFSVFPDVFNMRRIRDRGEHAAQTLGLEHEYRAVFGKPSRGYVETLLSSPISKTHPGASAYQRIQDLKRKFLSDKLGQGPGFSESARGDALYNYKLAVRFKDKAAADKYLAMYIAFGGTRKGLEQSLAMMHPLGGLSKDNKKAFLETLGAEDKALIAKAEEYYRTVLLGDAPIHKSRPRNR